MGANAVFTSTPRIGVAVLATADTDHTGASGTIVDALGQAGKTIPAAGTKIQRVVIEATGNPADGVVMIFLSDGTTYFLFDEIDMGDPATDSVTVAGYRVERTYEDLVLPTGWKIAGAITATPTAGSVNMFVLGGDLT